MTEGKASIPDQHFSPTTALNTETPAEGSESVQSTVAELPDARVH